MKRKKNKQVRAYGLGGIILLLMVVVIIAACISMGIITINGDFSFPDNCSGNGNPVSAMRTANTGKTYSDVLTDLKKDTAFNANDFPTVEKDYSLKLVQLAESTDGELFVYVYAPTKREAREIRFSTAINDNAKYIDYTLTLCSTAETLSKYVVNDFNVLPDALRYYDVVQLTRAFDEDIDPPRADGNTVSNMAYAVVQEWRASTVDGVVTYAMLESETITVTNKFVDFLQYGNGFFLVPLGRVESHYVAFATDRQIDKLMQADITYISKPYNYTSSRDTYVYGEETTVSDTIKAEKKVEHSGGIFGYRHVWNRIESVNTFIAKETLSNEAKTAISKMQWVLRFTETAWDGGATSTNWWQNGTKIDDVTILRLKFETAGKTYNLGVVDNKQSGDMTPGNLPDKPTIFHLWDIIVKICTAIWNAAKTVFMFVTRYWKWFVIGFAAVLALALVVKIIAAAVRK